MLDKYFTFFATNSLPLRGENSSAVVSNKRAKFVENPTDIITTELSGCFESISRYRSCASGALEYSTPLRLNIGSPRSFSRSATHLAKLTASCSLFAPFRTTPMGISGYPYHVFIMSV